MGYKCNETARGNVGGTEGQAQEIRDAQAQDISPLFPHCSGRRERGARELDSAARMPPCRWCKIGCAAVQLADSLAMWLILRDSGRASRFHPSDTARRQRVRFSRATPIHLLSRQLQVMVSMLCPMH